MIVQIRGTSGSGKTTAMKKVQDHLGVTTPYTAPGRKRPLYYYTRSGGVTVYLLGHYEAACGGCDTIGSAAAVYALIDTLLERQKGKPCVILAEGLLLSEDAKWTPTHAEQTRVLYLTTPLDTCIKQIKGRRAAAGNTKPLNTENTSRRVAVIERSRMRLAAAGVACYRRTADQAPGIIERWIIDFVANPGDHGATPSSPKT